MPEIINPETHHEKSDVNVRALLWFMVGFIVFAALSHLLVVKMFHFFVARAGSVTSEPLTMISRPADASIPPTPRLQPFPNRDPGGNVIPPNANGPVIDMAQLRAMEDQALHDPGWVDRPKGIVRVPIDVAKQLVVQRGLPVVKQ